MTPTAFSRPGETPRRPEPTLPARKAGLLLHAAVLLLLALTALAGCGGADGADARGRNARQRQLDAVDDSIANRAPGTRALLEEGMRTAPDSMAYYEYCLRMGKWFLLSATPDSMHACLARVRAFAAKQPPSPRRSTLLAQAYACRAAYLHNFHRQPDTVTALYTRAYRLLMEAGRNDALPDLCGNLADAYYFKDNLPEAAAWYRRALFLVDSLALPHSRNVTLYLGLARIYMNLNDFDTSLKYYRQTERYFRQMQPGMRAYFLNDYGSYYYYSKHYAASLGKFLQLQDMLQRLGMEHNFDMYLCRLNLADVYLNLGRVDKARRYLGRVEGYMRRMALYYVNTIKIGIALHGGDMAAVRRILASEPAGIRPMYSMVHIRNGYLQQYYARTGNYKRAYRLELDDRRLTDSMNSSRSNMRATEILDRFTQDTLRLHHDLAMQQKNAYIYRTRTWAAGGAAGAALLTLLLALYIMHLRKQQLKSRMHIMQLKLASARNRINPHFVFNVLNNNIAHVRSEAGAADTADRLQNLSRLIRANLDLSVRMTVPLADELAFVKRYVEVERPMAGPRFTFTVNVADGVQPQQVQVPSMFLQILTENALVHGLRGWEGDKRLDIDVQRTHEGTVITVTDNGKGFDARTAMPRKRTGLSIITQTVAAVNEHGKRKMRFSLRNLTDGSGHVCGCRSTLVVPDGISFRLC